MENQVYSWHVKRGNIVVHRNEHRISLQLDYGDGVYCLLANTDADEIVDILISLSKQIWEDPHYVKKPYTAKLYQVIQNVYHWDIDTSQLLISYNEAENAIEIKCQGSNRLDLEINYVVELIQVLEHLNQ